MVKNPVKHQLSSVVGLSLFSEKPNFNIKMRLTGYQPRHEVARFLVQEAGLSLSIRNAGGKTALQCKQQELQELAEDDEEENDVDAATLRLLVEC
jgi:hypothetical protein